MTHQTIAVAGTGYVGLSIATLLAQHNHVITVDIVPEKVDLIKTTDVKDTYAEENIIRTILSTNLNNYRNEEKM